MKKKQCQHYRRYKSGKRVLVNKGLKKKQSKKTSNKYRVGRFAMRADVASALTSAGFQAAAGSAARAGQRRKATQTLTIRNKLDKLDSQYSYHLKRRPNQERRLSNIYFREREKLLRQLGEAQGSSGGISESVFRNLSRVDFNDMFQDVSSQDEPGLVKVIDITDRVEVLD